MKPIFLILIFSLVFGGSAVSETVNPSEKKEDLKLLSKNTYLYWNVNNTIVIRSKEEKIEKILIDSGKVTKINDTVFNVKPVGKATATLSFAGRQKYLKRYPVKKLPTPTRLYFKGIPINDLEEFSYLYTTYDLKKSNKLEAAYDGYIFRVKQFWISCSASTWKIKLPNSPVFKSDSISPDYIQELERAPDNTAIMAHDVELISPDSTVIKRNNMSLGFLLKDSTSLIIRRYGGYLKMHSDLRIKISGRPDAHDLKTIDEIIKEVNSCLPTFNVKKVKYFPSLTINFDSISKPFNPKNPFWTQEVSKILWNNSNLFFPYLSKASVDINYNIYDRNGRDSLLWRIIPRVMINSPRIDSNNKNSVFNGLVRTGLTHEDKLAIKTIFSRGINKKIDAIWPSTIDYISPVSFSFIIILVVNILLFLILGEVVGYIGLYISEPVKRVIYSFVFSNLVLFTIFIIKPVSFANFGFARYAVYFNSFSIIAGVLFLFSDKISERFAVRWSKLRLLINPVFTFISLYIAYQIIYMFVRGEVLRLQTIDRKALIIGSTILIVRLFQEYVKTKISKLLRDKEFEIVKQKELKYRAELNALHARINPHFLYNSLNSIAALARIDTERTEKMALSLSKFFRFTLNREEDMTSTIGKEIEMAQLYLEIEKNRFAEKLEYSIEAEEGTKDWEIPRLLIQPLVENSVKHGISKLTGQGFIRIKVYEKNKSLVIEVYDNGPAFPEGLLSGYGLQNIYDKLSLVYNRPYEIKFINKPEKYIQIVLK